MREHDDFLNDPRILECYGLLDELGMFAYIDGWKKQARDYENLLSASAEIFKQTDIDNLFLATVLSISDRFLPTFVVFIWKPRPGRSEYVIRGFRNLKEAEIPVPPIDLANYEEFFHKSPFPVSVVDFKNRFDNPAAARLLETVGPEIIVPVVGPSGLYGLILIGPKVLQANYADNELAFIQRLMSFTSIAIQNHLHYEYSVRDPKTGLFNHAFFMVRLNEEISRSRRTGRPFCIIVFDVDLFKSFNDGYGHLAGDRVLEVLAETLKNNMRDVDVLARFGGEEFTVLLPETERLAAWDIAERLRMVVMETEVAWVQHLPKITISAGIAEFQPASNESAVLLLNRADEALYCSKERGRNRTTVWGGGLFFRSNIVLNGQVKTFNQPTAVKPKQRGLFNRSKLILEAVADQNLERQESRD